MLRALFETFGMFLAPFAAFAVYLVLRARYPLAVEHWTRGRLSGLALAGLAAAAGFLLLATWLAPRGHGLYVPAHIENGAIVPGRFQ